MGLNGNARPRGTDRAEVIQVIMTKSLVGRGTNDDPCCIITQYWDLSGNLLAQNDPMSGYFDKEG